LKRIKKNDLLPWFTDDHGTLPASYLRSCEEFFQWLEDCKRNGFKAPSSKPQATSGKLDKTGFRDYKGFRKE
tara:strand:- start:88 stop:303 length:216 start_codon:yes stop_codon:yes gene_type:complete